MAANPLITCNPATSWYDFPYPLSWSNECEVAEILSDIPFISVGILVFGTSALFFVMKRISLSTVLLFLSVFLAFLAAILDLSKTLAIGMAITTTPTTSEAVVKVREVFLALSVGLRFLFYWIYVAEPSRKDPSTAFVQEVKFLILERTHGTHSGSWLRWGLPGKLLRVGLLLAIITITILQIVWRVVPRFHQYSNVYGTDAALELLASFLLLLKLLLNTLPLNSPDNMLVHTFRECLAPISGLLVNVAIGVGDLLCFAFTESTVGRLLQALEVYIIVVFVVVAAFLRHRDILLSPSQGKKRRDVMFTLPEPARGSTFRITPPLIETPRMSMILGAAIPSKESSWEPLHRSARRSLNHVSSWVSSRISRNRAHYEDEGVRLWNAENVKVDPPYTENTDSELACSVSSMQEPKELLRDAPATVNHTSIISALDAQSALARSMEGSIYSGQNLYPHRADVSQRVIQPQVRTSSIPVSSVCLPTSSGVEHAGNTTAAASEASPVYGLSGIRSRAGASDSRTSLDELLRQQNQLDQSIEALKLFSTRTSANSLHSHSATSPRSGELSRSPSTGQRTISSEVSLSSFPVPPWLTPPVPSLPSSRPTSVKRMRGSRRARFATAWSTPVQDTYSSVPPTTSASLVDIPSSPCPDSIPCSPSGEGNESITAESGRFSCFDSGAAQYNVTSFIGGLATPGEPGQVSQEKPWWPRESNSSVEAIQTSSIMKRLPTRTLPVPRQLEGLPASPAVAKLSSFARSSVLSRGIVMNEPPNIVQHQTQISHALPVAPSPHITVTDHAEKSLPIPPTKHQLVRATDPPIANWAEGTHRVQKIFVRPRPPPLVIHPYTGQNSGIPRVQVLADD